MGAVSAQSDLHTWGNPNQSPLYTALVEAYPNIRQDQYSMVLQHIQNGRKGVQDSTSELLKQLTGFENWRNTEIIFHPAQVKMYPFPDSNLHVTVGSKTLTGAAAEEQMWKVARNPDAVAAFETSRGDTPLEVPQN